MTAWQPTADEVHAKIPTRPAWDTNSKPSLDEVTASITMTADSLVSEYPAIPAALEPVAKSFVAYRVAADIEWAYDPEQQFGGDNAMAPHLDQMAGAELARLRTMYASATGTTPTGNRAFTIGALPITYAPGVVTPDGYYPAY